MSSTGLPSYFAYIAIGLEIGGISASSRHAPNCILLAGEMVIAVWKARHGARYGGVAI